jgi:type III secretion protein W
VGENVSGSNIEAQMRINAARTLVREERLEARQIASSESFTEAIEDSANPFSADKETEFKSLQQRREKLLKAQQTEPGRKILAVQSAMETAERFQRNNPELQARALMFLRNAIHKDLTPEEALDKVLEFYPDVALADEALEFLIETADKDTLELLKASRELLQKRSGREVTAGRNVGGDARTSAQQGIGTPSNLRDLYRDITGNPREQNALFDELSGKYNYDQLKAVIDFLLKSLGSDLKSKGPSIARGELYRLLTETRVLQSILGIYLFFKGRSNLIAKLFAQGSITLPPKMTFEQLAKEFMKLVEDHYPNAAKIIRVAAQFGLDKDTLAQVILFNQYRDAIRQMSPRIYRSIQHRYELLNAILEALEQLEEEIEEDEEEKGGDEKKGKQEKKE